MTLKYNSQYNESTEGEKESILNWLFGDHFFPVKMNNLHFHDFVCVLYVVAGPLMH